MDRLKKRPPTPAESYDLIVPVWGEKYVDMFLKYCLPSQLAPGNLPALPRSRCLYHIYTSPADVKRIWKSDVVRKLRELAEVQMVTFSEADVLRDFGQSQGYVKNLQKMTWCYHRAMHNRRGVDAAFVYMTPDSVWADGAFRHMDECQRAGVRALMGLGLITQRERLQHDLTPFIRPDDNTVLEITPRQLVSKTMDALHPLGAQRFVQEGGNRFMSAYYWNKPGEGFVARCFYLHPIMVRPRVNVDFIPCTVDYRYVPLAVPDPEEVQVITDSDQLFYVDMADLNHAASALSLRNYERPEILDWMCEWTDSYHRQFFQQSIIVHEHDAQGEFDQELAAAQQFADSLLPEYEEYFPVSSRKPYPSNLFFGEQFDALEASPPLPNRSRVKTAWYKASDWSTTLRELPWRTARQFYRFLTSRLTMRIDQLEDRIARLEARPEYGQMPYLLRSEFELRREIDRLRLELGQRQEERQQVRLHSESRQAVG